MEHPDFSQLCGKTILLTKKDYTKATGRKPGKFEELNLHFGAVKTQARDIIKGMKDFTFDGFEANYFTAPTDKDDIFSILDARGKEMRAAGRISTAITFECGLKSLKEFTGKEKFPFERVTVKFLKDYEKWMLTREK